MERTEEEEVKRRALVAQAKIQKGQVSRARHVLTGVSSSSKEQHNIRFVAREKSSGAEQGDPTRGVGIFIRTHCGVEPEDFHQVFAGGSLWKFTRSRGLYQRDAEGVPG